MVSDKKDVPLFELRKDEAVIVFSPSFVRGLTTEQRQVIANHERSHLLADAVRGGVDPEKLERLLQQLNAFESGTELAKEE